MEHNRIEVVESVGATPNLGLAGEGIVERTQKLGVLEWRRIQKPACSIADAISVGVISAFDGGLTSRGRPVKVLCRIGAGTQTHAAGGHVHRYAKRVLQATVGV